MYVGQTAMEIAAKELEWMINTSNANMRQIPGPVYNVKGYGAKGDGKTDDTEAIQSAINTCGLAGGGIVFFPPGVYLMGLVKVKYKNVYLVGTGIGSTKIIMKPLNDAALFQFGDYGDVEIRGTVSNVGISDMEIDGNKSNQYQGSDPEDGSAIGVRVEDVTHVSIRRIKVHHCDGYGIGIVGTGLPNRSDLIVEDVETHNNNYDGIDIKGGFERVWIQRLKSFSNGPGFIPSRQSHGMDIRGEHVYISDCLTHDNYDSGLNIRELYALKNIDVVNHKSYGNRVDGISVVGNITGRYVFTSCYAYDNQRHGVSVENGTTYLNSCVINENALLGIWMKTDAECSVFVDGGSVSFNGQDGIATNNNRLLNISSVNIKQNGRSGVYLSGSTKVDIKNADIEGNGTANRENGVGILMLNQSGKWSIQGCSIYDEQALTDDKQQKYGIQFSGTNSAGMIIGNDLSGNWHSSIYPNVPTGTIVDDNGSLYRGSATLNPASLANGEGVTLTINVSGAALGDFVLFSAPYNLQALTVTAYVSANNVVSIRIQNDSGATVDLDAGTWKVKVIKG